MVKFRRGQSSGYVDDQRGRRVSGGALAGGGGIVGVIIAVVVALASGGGGGGAGFDVTDVLGQLGGVPGGQVEADPNIETGTGGEADDATEDFMRAVMNSLQDEFWPQVLGNDFQPTTLVLFTAAVNTACGQAPAAVGPFYCPGDSTAYIDLSFFDDLRTRFGAPGEFAQAYVIAHEVGHHVQNLLGTNAQVRQAPQSEQEGADGLLVRLELQADCFAGMWAGSVFGPGQDIELTRQDIADALEAAEAIGDDRLQQQAGAPVDPDSWTHGSSEQRQDWFTRGFEADGNIRACDTFSASI